MVETQDWSNTAFLAVPWLLIFDNVESNEILLQSWPVTGIGSIVVTCRSEFKAMSPANRPLEVTRFDSNESVELMLKLMGKVEAGAEETEAARELAKRTGGLAIALDILAKQVFMRKMMLTDFLKKYNEHRKKLLVRPKRGAKDPYYSEDVSTIWSTAFESMSKNSGRLLSLLCYTAPDDIPQKLLSPDGINGLEWPFLLDFEE